MAVNKIVNKSTKSHGAMKNVLQYVLRDQKVKDGYVEIAGPYSGNTINYDEVYQTWLAEKKLWNKDSGRMYAHHIISFHKDEQVTPEQVLRLGTEYADRFFPDFQYVVGVHQDKDHLHCHILVNSVSYLNGKKLHQTKLDLELQKEFTNDLCREKGLSVTEKGRRFDGSLIDQGEITAWSKDKYNLLINDTKKSFLAECAIALCDVVPQSTNREEFIKGMEERGWSVQWTDSRKHIVFQDKDGNKIRDSNITKTFSGLDVSKEALLNEFARQDELRSSRLKSERETEQTAADLERYYSELESAVSGLVTAKAVRDNPEAKAGGTEPYQRPSGFTSSTGPDDNRVRTVEERGTSPGYQDNTESFLRELNAKEKASRKKRNNLIAERKDRDSEHFRSSVERSKEVKTRSRNDDLEL